MATYRSAAPRDFLVTATPGAGKTVVALAIATWLRSTREVDRVVVICPTDHLRRQWAAAAADAGLLLDPTLPNSVGPVPAGTAGYVATYAQVAAKPLLHRRRVEARRSLVILDEVHHAGDALSWGEAVAEAFEPARRRLSLSGTPFRTRPNERIPFVRYDSVTDDDGSPALVSVADHGYSYRQALADGVVRPVMFAAYTGESRWRTSAGEVVSASLSEPASADQEGQAWRTALDPGGAWVPHVLAAMDVRISQLRRSGMPDAAGLVLASDQDSARAYARIVAAVTGEAPVVVTSDDPQAGRRLEEFRDSTERICVCVRMVSEGVDIPRAACLAWLTSYRTPLFFAQAVGRVVRARHARESATVFLPAVRPLLTLAAALEEERNHVVRLRSSDPDGLDDLVLGPRPEAGEGDGATPLGAQARFAHVLHGGRAVVAADLDDGDADYLGLPGLLSPEQIALLLARRDRELGRRAEGVGAGAPATTAGQPPSSPAARPWEHAAALRRELHRLVGQVAARTGEPHAAVHARLRRQVPGPGSATATAGLLARRRDALLGEL